MIRRDVRGVVYVEFLLVFLPVFVLFLAVLQLGFVYAGRLIVQHGAASATRAAVVVLDDDPARYGGEPRGRLDPGGVATNPSPVDALLAGLGLGGTAGGRGSPRFRDVHAAGSIPLLAVAPSVQQLQDVDTVFAAIGRGGDRAAAGGERYNQAALAVSFPTEPGATSFRTTFGKDELVTVRLTYLFHCAVPLVARIMCDAPDTLAGRLTADEVAQLDLGFLAGMRNARYLVLRGEATLRNQGAGYRYPSEVP